MNEKLLITIAVTAVGFLALGGTALAALGDDVSDSFTQWDSYFKTYGGDYGVPWRWLKAICTIESSLGSNPSVASGIANPSDTDDSVSSDGKSWGLMQLTLATANGLEGPGLTPIDLNNPNISVRLSAKLVAQLISTFGIDDRESVIRAYNGGPNFGDATVPYYTKFVGALTNILAQQPGNELET